MAELTTRDNIESLVKNLFSHRVNYLPLIGMDNFVLLRGWALRHGMNDPQIFEGVPEEILEHCRKKDVPLTKKMWKSTTSPVKTLVDMLGYHENYTSNQNSIRIFDNIEKHFNAGPEIFLKIGEEVIKKSMRFKLLTHATGNSVSEMVYAFAALNSGYNKTKNFKILKSENVGGVHEIIVQVEHKPGLWQRAAISNWNFGINKAVLDLSRDEVLDYSYPKNDESGYWLLKAKFIPKSKSPLTYLFSPITKAASQVLMENLELYRRAMMSETELLLQSAEAQSRDANTTLKCLEMRHPNSAYHSLHLILLMALTAKQFDYGIDKIESAVRATMLHDIGKNSVPDTILHKPGRFEHDELVIMQLHAVLGEHFLLKSGYPMDVVKMVGNHHTSPNGKVNPLDSILQFWDSFIGLTERRIYRDPPAYDLEKAIQILYKDIDTGRIHPLSRIILDETLPMLIREGYHPHAFDHSLAKPNGENYEQLIQNIQDYVFGKTNMFDLKTQVSLDKYTHKLETPEETLEGIRNYISSAYNRLQTIEFKEVFRRIVSDELRVYLPDDGVKTT